MNDDNYANKNVHSHTKFEKNLTIYMPSLIYIALKENYFDSSSFDMLERLGFISNPPWLKTRLTCRRTRCRCRKHP